MERLNGTFRDHLKATRRIGKVTLEMVQRYVDFYNYIRPHMGLGGDTSAEKAGIVIEYDDKLLMVAPEKPSGRRPPETASILGRAG